MWLASSQSTSVCWERGDLSHSVWLFSKGWGQETTEKCAAKQTINRRQDLRWFSSLLSFFLSVSLRHYVGYLLCSVRYNESSLSTAEHRMGIVPVAIRQLLFWSSQKCSSERSLLFSLAHSECDTNPPHKLWPLPTHVRSKTGAVCMRWLGVDNKQEEMQVQHHNYVTITCPFHTVWKNTSTAYSQLMYFILLFYY